MFLRRLLGARPPGEADSTAPVATTITGPARFDGTDQLAVLTVGAVSVPAAVYQGFQRDRQDWSSGIRLEDPSTGRWLRATSQYPPDLRAAGARPIAVAGVAHHPDASRDDFAVGRMVRLVPEPTNRYDPRAIAIRSADGRYCAGYVPAEELDEVLAAQPASTVGIVTWENFTWRPRRRIGIRLVIGPSISLTLVPPNRIAAERARRDAAYAAGQEAERVSWEQERVAREARDRQVAQWRAEGRCVECGAEVEPKGRFVRCLPCRQARGATINT